MVRPGGTAYAAPDKPVSHAKATALIDVTSGRLLYSDHGDDRMLIASLTKIMTAIVAIENGKLTDVVKVSPRAAKVEGSSIYLKAGEKMPLQDLLYGLMLRSGNDAATAIAEHVGGSIDGFAFLMNRKAEELGLANSHFVNPSGLDHKDHYSSANDLAKLTAYAMHNKTFKEIVKTKEKLVSNRDYEWLNKNKMLRMYDGADGVKTGYTKQALRCLVSSATRNGQQLVAVTLNDGDDWADHQRLLDFGFMNYPLQQVVKQDEGVAGYPYRTSADFRYPFAAGEREQLRIRLTPYKSGGTDYALGYRGKLTFRLGEQTLGSVFLLPQPGVANASPDTAAPTLAEPDVMDGTLRMTFGEALRRSLRSILSFG
ncbi:D-alanyl-D-alanine carboxypeptidase family protein [Cohnella nanjingensis]|uniref:D-alanyl-D-alanine carboxypeptidase n=2 Tax=Cohnella nanjingensis TaxID=1387779 RepID=A0A7X0RXA9_9BACL|nr:D-alanyl-D-alanine carboxypeptidase family protein [Cohnella nanjingensis]MBB6674191.1 D-alanyl-D-alanine carboxypeptidase [Cohnella nanjingensis]